MQQSKTPQAGSTDQLLTPRKAAGILSVSRSTLYALINSGELRSVKIRGARRLLASDVQGYIQSRLLHLFNQQSAISNRQSSIQEIYLILWVGG